MRPAASRPAASGTGCEAVDDLDALAQGHATAHRRASCVALGVDGVDVFALRVLTQSGERHGAPRPRLAGQIDAAQLAGLGPRRHGIEGDLDHALARVRIDGGMDAVDPAGIGLGAERVDAHRHGIFDGERERPRPIGRIDRMGGTRRRDGDEPRPDPPRRPGGEPRRPGQLGAAEHDGMAPVVFVADRRRPAERARPELGAVLPGRRSDPVQDVVRDADIGDLHGAAAQPSRHQQMAGLAAKEGDRRRGRRGGAEDRAGVAMHAARDVDGEAGQPPVGDDVDQPPGHPVQGAGEPGAEQRIDHHGIAIEDRRIERSDIAPALRRAAGVALESLHGHEAAEPHRPPGLAQQAGRDEAVAAVIAGPAQHGDRSVRPAPPDGRRDRRTRAFHELDPGPAARNGQAVGAPHLGDREQHCRGSV